MSKLFDPILIIYQIVALQCSYYLCLSTFFMALHIIFFEGSLSLDQLFDDNAINFISATGLVNVGVTLLTSVIGAYSLSVIVEKCKKCVDFTFTLYFIHIITCWFYKEFPCAWEWWIVQIFAAITMGSLGEYFCAEKEMEDIPLYNNGGN